jgi:hypothetical protein
MSIGRVGVNYSPINGASDRCFGRLIRIDQLVGIEASGNLIPIEQSVVFEAKGEGNLIALEQSTTTEASGKLITLEQDVRVFATPLGDPIPWLDRMGWDATLVVGGQKIDPGRITKTISISRTESSTALMTVSYFAERAIQDVSLLIGQSVTLDIQKPNGNYRVYTGLVDDPMVDLVEGIITLQCTDRRKERINAQIGNQLQQIGVYSEILFGEKPDESFRELESRLSTTPEAVDFDAYGNIKVTPWAAKGSPDFTFTASDIKYDNNEPTVDFTSRGSITNKIDIRFQFRFERFHHWERDFRWESTVKNKISLVLQDGYKHTRRDLVLNAIESAGWPVKGTVSFDPIPPSGWYGDYAWSTSTLQGETNIKTNTNGIALTDQFGKVRTETRITRQTDFSNILCEGANWTASTRWAQTITDLYQLTLTAPQSIAQYGEVQGSNSYSQEAETDGASWENYDVYEFTPGQLGTFFIDEDGERDSAKNAVAVALQRAKVSILGSHRDTRVKFSSRVFPQVDLSNTIQINTPRITAKGKVFKIEHFLDIRTGDDRTEITLVLSKSTGSATDSDLIAPESPTDVSTLPQQEIILDNHWGMDPATTEGSESWTGLIANIRSLNLTTDFSEQFIVEVPEVSDNERKAKEREKTQSYTMSIPDDLLIIDFDKIN